MLTWAVVVLNRVHAAYELVGAWYGDAVWEVALLEVAHASPLTRESHIEEVRQLVRREVFGLFIVVRGGPVACRCLVLGPSGDVCPCRVSHGSFLRGVRVGFDSCPERDLGGGFECVGCGVEDVGVVGDAFNVEVVGVLA